MTELKRPNPYVETKVLLERAPFRFVEKGVIDHNGKPDFRLQERDYYNNNWYDVYYFDNGMQCTTAMEDIEYAKWLTNKPCYVGDKGPHKPS